MNHPARLMSVATASPPFSLQQTDIAAMAGEMFSSRYDDFERLSKVFTTSGIETRQSVMPLDWYRQTLGWPERTAAFIAGGEALFIAAAGRALDAAGLSGTDVDTVVMVSSTGVATPSLEARVSGAMGFRPTSREFRSSASDAPAACRACRSARGSPRRGRARTSSSWSIELCTLSFRLRPPDQGQHRGDGAVRRRRGRLRAPGRRRRRAGVGRGHGRAHLARHARHHGLGRRPARASA